MEDKNALLLMIKKKEESLQTILVDFFFVKKVK